MEVDNEFYSLNFTICFFCYHFENISLICVTHHPQETKYPFSGNQIKVNKLISTWVSMFTLLSTFCYITKL